MFSMIKEICFCQYYMRYENIIRNFSTIYNLYNILRIHLFIFGLGLSTKHITLTRIKSIFLLHFDWSQLLENMCTCFLWLFSGLYRTNTFYGQYIGHAPAIILKNIQMIVY